MKPPADAEARQECRSRYGRCGGAVPRDVRGSSCPSFLPRHASGRFRRRDWTSTIRHLRFCDGSAGSRCGSSAAARAGFTMAANSCLVRLTESVSGRISRSHGSSGRQNLGMFALLLCAFLQFDVHHFGFQLILELVTGALEFGHELSQLAGESWHLLWPHDDQSQQENED